MILKLKPMQSECIHCLARGCLLLDDGYSHPCVQLILFAGIYCKYFLDAVLPTQKELYEEIILQNNDIPERREERISYDQTKKSTDYRNRPRLRKYENR